MKSYCIIICFALLTCSFAFSKENSAEDGKSIKKLYRTFKNGEISQCKFNGEKFFVAGLNAFDAGTYIYNKDGNKVASCNHAWGIVNSICGKLQECEVQDNLL